MSSPDARIMAANQLTRALLTIAAGFFIYDAFTCVVRYEGAAYLLHGVMASILYSYGAITGRLGYYGACASSARA